ncbi:MAG: RNA methyltransferase [Acidobacteriota bacterium]
MNAPTSSTHSLGLVATCALGLEDFVAAELAALVPGRIGEIEKSRGAVTIPGDWTDVYRANWRLRTANRVLVEIASFDGVDGEALYQGAKALVLGGDRFGPTGALGWFADLLHPDRTFSIQATTAGSEIRDSRWAALRVKDGIVDAQRERWGRRANVEREDPDLALRLRLHRDRATLLLDTSGEPLDRRGYRLDAGAAPVREHLAAACVLAAGWDGQGPIVDPMCGAGTLLIEAADIALGRAPGRLRKSFAFERLPGFDSRRYARVRSEAIPSLTTLETLVLYGNDLSGSALAAAKANLERTDLLPLTHLTRGDAFALETPAPAPGLLLVNPPHGHRLEEPGDPGDLWRQLGDLLKQRFRGYRAVVLAGESQGKGIGLKPKRRIPIWNGPLEGRILIFDLY